MPLVRVLPLLRPLLLSFGRVFSKGARDVLERPRSVAIVIHPLADESELLKELGKTPEECHAADAYWRFADAVHWVEFQAEGAWKDPPGIYYAFDAERHQDQFRIVFHHDRVSTADVHSALEVLEGLIDAGVADRARLEYDGRRLRLGDAPS